MQSPTHILDFSLESTPQNIDMGIKWCFSQNIILTGAKLITLNEINQSQNASWHAGPDATQTHMVTGPKHQYYIGWRGNIQLY